MIQQIKNNPRVDVWFVSLHQRRLSSSFNELHLQNPIHCMGWAQIQSLEKDELRWVTPDKDNCIMLGGRAAYRDRDQSESYYPKSILWRILRWKMLLALVASPILIKGGPPPPNSSSAMCSHLEGADN